jgi:hypothetical protein
LLAPPPLVKRLKDPTSRWFAQLFIVSIHSTAAVSLSVDLLHVVPLSLSTLSFFVKNSKTDTMSEQRKAVIKNADMEEKMQQDAVDIASKALSEYNIEKVRGITSEIIPCSLTSIND